VKKVLLIVRLLVEAMFGLCMAALLLLPEIWRGTLPLQFILGFLGMPRRYHASAEFQHVNVITLGGLLAVAIILLIGALCFKDVSKIIRKLRVSHHES
jgi:heme/copper-type cytochrome/quinol oxidase subunit 1